MVIGCVISIIDFIVICAVDNGDYLDDEVRQGLFGSIICYIYLVYMAFISWGYQNINKVFYSRLYKICDVIMDILLVTYMLLLVK